MEQGTGNKEGFRGLVAWQRADELASAVFRVARALPDRERWLASQAVRAAISVPANIAEGYGRGSLGDYLRHLDIARGSLAELEYYLHFFDQERLIPSSDAERLRRQRQDAGRLLYGLWKSLKQQADEGTWDHTGRIREPRAAYVTDATYESENGVAW